MITLPATRRQAEKTNTVTERLTAAGKLLGIEGLDHINHGEGSNDVQDAVTKSSSACRSGDEPSELEHCL